MVVHFGLLKQKACQIKMVVQYDKQHNVPSQTCKIGQNPSIYGGFTIHCNPQSVSIIYSDSENHTNQITCLKKKKIGKSNSGHWSMITSI